MDRPGREADPRPSPDPDPRNLPRDRRDACGSRPQGRTARVDRPRGPGARLPAVRDGPDRAAPGRPGDQRRPAADQRPAAVDHRRLRVLRRRLAHHHGHPLALPVMALLLVLGPRVLPEYRDPGGGRLDLVGAALSVVAVLAVIFGLKQTAQDGFGWLPAASIAAGTAVAIAFV